MTDETLNISLHNNPNIDHLAKLKRNTSICDDSHQNRQHHQHNQEIYMYWRHISKLMNCVLSVKIEESELTYEMEHNSHKHIGQSESFLNPQGLDGSWSSIHNNCQYGKYKDGIRGSELDSSTLKMLKHIDNEAEIKKAFKPLEQLNPTEIVAQIRDILHYLWKDKFQEAISMLRALFNMDSHMLGMRFLLALILATEKKYRSALFVLENLTHYEHWPWYSSTYVRWGVILIELRELEEAESILQKAIKMNENDILAYGLLAEIALIKNLFADAIELAEKIIEINANEEYGYLIRGMAFPGAKLSVLQKKTRTMLDTMDEYIKDGTENSKSLREISSINSDSSDTSHNNDCMAGAAQLLSPQSSFSSHEEPHQEKFYYNNQFKPDKETPKKIKWEWQCNPDPLSSEPKEWKPYNEDDNNLLEEAYKMNLEEMDIGKYIIVFKTSGMYQQDKADLTKRRPVRRNDSNIAESADEIRNLKTGNQDLFESNIIQIYDASLGSLENFIDFLKGRGEIIQIFSDMLEKIEITKNFKALNQDIVPLLINSINKEAVKIKQHIKEKKYIIELFEREFESFGQFYGQILKAYTLETFLFRRLNLYLRNMDWDSLDCLLPYVYCLCKAFLCSEVNSDKSYYQDQTADILTLYRGAIHEELSLSAYSNRVNSTFSWNSVISTSTNPDIAEFATLLGDDVGKVGVLFIIEVPIDCKTQRNFNLIAIRCFSIFPEEDEILIAPGRMFKVKSFTKKDKGYEIRLRMMECQSMSVETDSMMTSPIPIVKSYHDEDAPVPEPVQSCHIFISDESETLLQVRPNPEPDPDPLLESPSVSDNSEEILGENEILRGDRILDEDEPLIQIGNQFDPFGQSGGIICEQRILPDIPRSYEENEIILNTLIHESRDQRLKEEREESKSQAPQNLNLSNKSRVPRFLKLPEPYRSCENEEVKLNDSQIDSVEKSFSNYFPENVPSSNYGFISIPGETPQYAENTISKVLGDQPQGHAVGKNIYRKLFTFLHKLGAEKSYELTLCGKINQMKKYLTKHHAHNKANELPAPFIGLLEKICQCSQAITDLYERNDSYIKNFQKKCKEAQIELSLVKDFTAIRDFERISVTDIEKYRASRTLIKLGLKVISIKSDSSLFEEAFEQEHVPYLFWLIGSPQKAAECTHFLSYEVRMKIYETFLQIDSLLKKKLNDEILEALLEKIVEPEGEKKFVVQKVFKENSFGESSPLSFELHNSDTTSIGQSQTTGSLNATRLHDALGHFSDPDDENNQHGHESKKKHKPDASHIMNQR